MPNKTVFPIPGLFAVGYPATEHEVSSDDDLDAHLASGAFALTAAEARKRSPLPNPKPETQTTSKER